MIYLKKFWRWARGTELLLLTGPSVFVYLLQFRKLPTLYEILSLMLFTLGVYTLGLHIMFMNTYGGAKVWDQDRGGMDYRINNADWNPLFFRNMGIGAFILSLFFLSFSGIHVIILASLLAILWDSYAIPPVCLKGRPGFDLGVHLISGYLQAMLGSVAYHGDIKKGLTYWGWVIAFVLVGGFFHHIIKDEEVDKKSGLRTSLALFPGTRAFFMGNTFFMFGHILIFWYCIREFRTFTAVITFFYSIIFTIQFVAFIRAWKEMHNHSTRAVIRYRSVYRLLFTSIGLMILILHFMKGFAL